MSVKETDYRNNFQGILNRACDLVIEHCSSVTIIATVEDENGGSSTRIHYAGRGNYFAQVGSVREYLIAREEETRVDAEQERLEELEDKDDAGGE